MIWPLKKKENIHKQKVSQIATNLQILYNRISNYDNQPQLHVGLYGYEIWNLLLVMQIHQVHLPAKICYIIIVIFYIKENEQKIAMEDGTALTCIACPVCLTTTIWNLPCIWPIVRVLLQYKQILKIWTLNSFWFSNQRSRYCLLPVMN